jgi:hypothetical protein
VVDLSSPSDEGEPIPTTSRDFEFTQRLFGELDHSLLGPFGDGKIIILNDPDEEKEKVREEKSTDAEDAAASAAVNLASTAFADEADAPAGAKNNSDDEGLDQEADGEDGGRDDTDEP